MIKKILIAFLLLLFCWAIYLMQVDPEAEAFFYSYPEQEKEKIDLEINSWLNDKTVKIPIVGDVDTFNCVIDVDWNLKENGEACASNEELLEIIVKNQILLDKYQLYKKDPEKSESLSGQTLINGHRLLMIKIYLMTFEGAFEKSLNLLIDDNKFWLIKLTAGTSTWVSHALYTVHLNLNYRILPFLLNTEHNFTESEYSKLKNLLTSISTKDFNVESVIRMEFELLKKAIPELKKDNHQIGGLFLGAFINQTFEDTQEFLKITKLSVTESCTKILSNPRSG